MIRVGLVGIGFMGWIHYLSYRKVRGVSLAAIVSRDEKKRAGDWIATAAATNRFGSADEPAIVVDVQRKIVC